MADLTGRTEVKTELKTEHSDNADTKNVQDLTVFVSSKFADFLKL